MHVTLCENDRIQVFNQRFRKVPTFGRDAIRRFSSDVAAMKKLAARDFEDILQCIIPVMEGLLPPPHDEIIADLLFILAFWHALAKLRLHTEFTLEHLKKATRDLGASLRHFLKTTCKVFATYELPKELAARGRWTAALAANGKGESTTMGRKLKFLNLLTYKLHALGDYLWTIIVFGPTDNYTTQVGELEHRRVKKFYVCTNKNKHAFQIAKHQRREALLHRMTQ
ncbi:hypothetical protein BKA93DRAFT_48371 [Sparassis latifolia]